MARELDEEQRSRLDAKWTLLNNATREMMNIARRKPDSTTYNQAIHFGEAIAPGVLGWERRLLHGVKESNEAKLCRQKALAETALRGHLTSGAVCPISAEPTHRIFSIAGEAHFPMSVAEHRGIP